MDWFMKPIKGLLLYSRGAPRKNQIIADSLLRGVFKIPYETPPPRFLGLLGQPGKKISNKFLDPYLRLGYANDWRDAFNRNPAFDLIECNINDLLSYWHVRALLKEVPITIVLHSAAGDDLSLLLATAPWFQDRKGKLVVFLGNEYDLMEEKKRFIREVGADYLCTQLPIHAARFVYGDSSTNNIIEMPHALNPAIFKPITKRENRRVKFGFIGAQYPNWIGDTERNDFINYFRMNLAQYNNDIQIGSGNILREHWAEFLNKCQGTIGAEAGTYFLDKGGLLISRAKRASSVNRDAKGNADHTIPFVNGKAISSRHFEPLGTKTVQLLLEGDYNGILQPDVHYLSVKKDFSNLSDKIAEFNDPARQAEIANVSYEYAMDCHTYDIRVAKLIKAVLG